MIRTLFYRSLILFSGVLCQKVVAERKPPPVPEALMSDRLIRGSVTAIVSQKLTDPRDFFHGR